MAKLISSLSYIIRPVTSKFRWLMLLVILGAATAFVVWSQTRPEVLIKYQITASFDYEGETLSSSGIWEELFYVTNWRGYDVLFEKLHGEALPFTAQDGTTFFLLLRPYGSAARDGLGLPIECNRVLLSLDIATRVEALRSFDWACEIEAVDLMLVAKGPSNDLSDLRIVRRDHAPMDYEYADFQGEVSEVTVSLKSVSADASASIVQKYPWISLVPNAARLGCEGCPSDPEVTFTKDIYRNHFVK